MSEQRPDLDRRATAAASGRDEIEVDVLIVGSGLLAHYLAGQLTDDYSVCLLVHPDRRPESLDTDGFFSAGYDGTDVGRIQPARRSAGFWSLWAESNDLPHRAASLQLLGPAEEAVRTRFWADAALVATPLDEQPAPFDSGSLADHRAYEAVHDVVIDPGVVLAALAAELDGVWLTGELADVVLAGDEAIDAIEVELGEDQVAIVPRATVFAAELANADLLANVAARTRDAKLRRERAQMARTCQAVRRQTQILLRGDLPEITAVFDGLRVVAHRLGGDAGGDAAKDGGEVVWVVTLPIDDTQTIEGPDDPRFEPPVDHAVIAEVVGRLLDAAPSVSERAEDLSWTARVRRKTEHPMMAATDTSTIPQPSPAKLETMDIEGFYAIWSGHLPFALLLGDVVAERLRQQLGPSAGRPDAVAGLGPCPVDAVAFYASDAPEWSSFEDFCVAHGIARD